METVRIGLVGFGTVGSSLFRLLQTNGADIAKRTGLDLRITRIGVRDTTKRREGAPRSLFEQGWAGIVADSEIAIVIELVGGVEIGYEITESALRAGKHVVTANKALLAERGGELFDLARRMNRRLKFEASVAGGIPIVKVLRESLMGNRIGAITGILNGTTNYILTRMTDEGIAFDTALGMAQEAGFAEQDPTMDVEGIDAGQKISLLAGVSYSRWIDFSRVHTEGVTSITEKDIAFARSAGFAIKLVASAQLIDGLPSVAVFPALVPQQHPLAGVRDEYNAIYVESDFLGTSVYLGRGAGGPATASSVASDLGDLVHLMSSHASDPGLTFDGPQDLYPWDQREFRYFYHFVTENRPGIWATVTGLLAENSINIESVHQKWVDQTQPSDLYVLVDPAREGLARKAHQEILDADGIFPESRYFRILTL